MIRETKEKKWRQYSKTYRANVKKKKEILVEELDVNTPPQSPGLNVDPLPSTSRLESGKKVRRTDSRKLRKAMKNCCDRLRNTGNEHID
ncbi:hypothetical protein AVEN_158882-1 [Araneus ventricosus]|uniref:Uncharacterized protein n=1 Tax=Araneus ventricosus TaxID=182803 RepID=A0A4Y2BBL7_ARAVE|nr:hypothetical protein AVEN_158882-1 [Araneus ventricosus]